MPPLCSDNVREEDLQSAFGRFGRISKVDVKQGFAFVEFDNDRDAADAAKGEWATSHAGCKLLGPALNTQAPRLPAAQR